MKAANPAAAVTAITNAIGRCEVGAKAPTARLAAPEITICRKPSPAEAAPAMVGNGASAPAKPSASTMPMPVVNTIIGMTISARPSEPAKAITAIAPPPARLSPTPATIIRSIPYRWVIRPAARLPARKPQTLNTASMPYWAGLRPRRSMNTNGEPAANAISPAKTKATARA